MRFALAFLALCWTGAAFAQQQQPSSDPVLRVETGMHTALIRRAAVDAAGKIFATASLDKTVRLWSLASGQLLRILRPPIGDGNEGKLYSVAVSPDGSSVIAGGWTGYQWQKTHSIYVFDAESGRLVRRIAGLPSVVRDLAWSRDGRFFASGLGNQGIRVFRADSGAEVGRDTDYGDDSYNVVFDRAGGLAAVGYDGFVRRYDAQFQRLAKEPTLGGKRPYSVAFSPDGTRLAIGYDDTTAIDVVAADTLKRLFSVDTSGVTKGNLSKVAWTADGALLAGGRYEDTGRRCPVLRWAQGGKGARTVLATANDTLTSLVTLADGGFAYATGEPAFGRYDAHSVRISDHRPDIADFAEQYNKLGLSADAMIVAFGLEAFGRHPMSFSLADRQLAAEPRPADIATADTSGLPVTNWLSSTAPKLSDKLLKLQTFEESKSVAVASDRQSLLLGTGWAIRRFDAAGNQVWERATPEVTWAVNLSRDGRLAVAAYGDGTIHWYRYSDGKELLALFVHKDGKRWVLWTPQGYYDASPGAEDLIGWHVNRGLDHEADFFPASRFRDRFYKPEVVSAVLRTLDIDKALAETQATPAEPLVAAALPPVLRILSPQEGSIVAASPVPLRYLVRTPSGERVTGIEVKVDGRPLPGDQGTVKLDHGPSGAQAEQEGALSVAIDHDATVTLVARAGDQRSEAANLRLLWRPPAPVAAAPPPDVPKPKLYMLAIGVSAYKDKTIALHYAAKDAGDVAAAWSKQEGGLYRAVETRVLRDDQATRDAVLDGLDWIERETTSRDVAVVMMAGHGENDADGAYYFLPWDVDPDRLRRTAVPDVEIRRTLSHVAGKALFFFDTCHSGSVMPNRARALPTDINGFVNELSSAENGLVVFAASTGREYALEDDSWHNGAFSKALIEGLSGKADTTGNGSITIAKLEYYLAERVKTLTLGQQHPTTAKPETIRDFPIAAVR